MPGVCSFLFGLFVQQHQPELNLIELIWQQLKLLFLRKMFLLSRMIYDIKLSGFSIKCYPVQTANVNICDPMQTGFNE
jgi:hypothetical protein